MIRKFFLLWAIGLFSILLLNGCEKKSEVAEPPKTEEITVSLSTSTQEVKGEQFSLELSDLKIVKTVDKSTKELKETPHLKGNIKIKNLSKNIMETQGITFQYLDAGGNVIPFKSGEKNATVSIYMKDLQPGKESSNFLDVTVPMVAVKEKSLSKIQANVVYIPTPLKRESLEVPVKLVEK